MYIPPDGSTVWFEFLDSGYTAPAGDNVAFVFSSLDVDYIIFNEASEVKLENGDHTVEHLPDVISEGSELKLTFTDSKWIPVAESYPLEHSLNILLRFTAPYPIPEGGASLTLRFGATGDAEIINEPSEIRLTNEDHQVSVIITILHEESEIKLESADAETEVIIELVPESSELKISVDGQLVEHLPECIPAATEFALSITAGSVSGGQPNDLPNKVGRGSIKAPWKKTEKMVKKHFGASWEKFEDIWLRKKSPWQEPVDTLRQTKAPFIGKMTFFDQHFKLPWGDFIRLLDARNSALYVSKMDYIDSHDKAEWGGFMIRNKKTVNRYTNTQLLRGDFKDRHVEKPWDKLKHFDWHKKNQFKNGLLNQINDKHHGTYWGPYWYSLWCQEQYFPYKGNEEVHLVLKSDFPNLTRPEFLKPSNPRCPFDYWYSGDRDGPVIPPPPWTGPIPLTIGDFYYMQNTVFVKRLPSMEDIEIYSVSMSIDMDSFLWDFSLVIPDRSYLDLIKPQGDTFIDIQININGYEWTCRVEEWSESITFGNKSWNVNGRSPSIELAEPFCNPYSYQNSTGAQAASIVSDLLSLTDWSFTWDSTDFIDPALDWLIPANLFSFTDKSIIHGIKQLVNTAGHFVNTVPDTNTTKELHIKPKYKDQPWNWYHSSISPDVMLVDSQCWEIGRKYNRMSKIDSIVLAGTGEDSGILSTVKKEGTAGVYTASMITSPLFTTSNVVRERGRMEIAESGNWINHTMRLFSLRPAPDGVGLVQIGSLAEFNESGDTWRGVVKSVSVNVQAMQTKTSVHVDQELEILEYQDG